MAGSEACPVEAMRHLAVFDLDGTIIDTSKDITSCLTRAFDLHAIKPPPSSEITKLIGGGTRRTVEMAMRRSGIDDRSAEVENIERTYVELYSAAIPGVATLYPGVLSAFDRLLSSNIDLAVCTNKSTDLAERLLAGLGIIHYFRAVVGCDYGRKRKPNPAHLIETVTLAGRSRYQAVMIGDSAADMLAAKWAGIPGVLVTFGYGASDEAKAAASALLSDYRDLDGQQVESLLSRIVRSPVQISGP